ncbi:DUF4873 domain-containing protein [Streptomyces sp. SID5770]|nr:DUF4873 domain-containing protein [Streptomyces sp. SID5770]
MDTYHGPATVITDEALYEVTASLVQASSAPGVPHWRGTLTVANQTVAWEIHQAPQPRLRVAGDDREGPFTVTNTKLMAGELVIKGNGSPRPFGQRAPDSV